VVKQSLVAGGATQAVTQYAYDAAGRPNFSVQQRMVS